MAIVYWLRPQAKGVVGRVIASIGFWVKIVQITTDNREHHREYAKTIPYFGTAPEALLQGFAKLRDVEVHVISCTQRRMSSPEKLADNIWFHSLHVPKIGWLRTGYQGCVRTVRSKLRQLQPDVVHGQGTERECALAAAFSGFINVVTIHGSMGEVAAATQARIGSFVWCAAKAEAFALRRTGGVLCNSAYTEQVVQRRNRRTWRVPNALRREFFERPLPQATHTAKPIILNIGVVGRRKRQLELLGLARTLAEKGLSFELRFVGHADPAGAYAAKFLREVAIGADSGFASYEGPRPLTELIDLLDGASGLVHAPSEEAFGLVVAEALARNLKCFGARTGGIPEIAEGVEGAELSSPGDDRQLGEAIARWLDEDSPRPTTAATEMRARYHPEVIARRHLEIYSEILANRL
ncbi:MAG: glycosyltransferase family 4 protein [Bryobacteraceae bacterium]